MRLTILLLATLLLAGCAATPGGGQRSEAADRAEALYRQGEFAAAADAFVAAAESSRGGRDRYLLRAAESWRELGELGRADQLAAEVSTRRLSASRLLRLDLLRAEAELELRNAPAAALAQLDYDRSDVPQAYRARFHDLRARAFADSDPVRAAAEHARLEPLLLAGERAANARRIVELLEGADDTALGSAAAGLRPDDAFYPYLARALSLRGLSMPAQAGRGPVFAGGDLPPAAGDGWRPPHRVALLLPDSGPLQEPARALRDGFFAAYAGEARRRPEVRVYDVGEDAEGAIDAWNRALADGAGAVVGPLSRDQVAALFAESAGRSPVPLLALNRGGALPPPPGSLSFALNPEDEAFAAAERLLGSGLTRTIAIGTDDDAGRRALGAFRARFEARGGTVLAEVLLPGTRSDWVDLLRDAAASAGAATGLPSFQNPMEPHPELAYEALFLAVDAATGRLLVPQLRVLDMLAVPALATSAINQPDGNRRLDREFDGLLVAEQPWLLDDAGLVPARPDLARELRSARGDSSRLFAFGHDAFVLTGHLERLGRDPAAQLEGLTGTLSLDGFGNVVRAPAWGLFRGGRVLRAGEPQVADELP